MPPNRATKPRLTHEAPDPITGHRSAIIFVRRLHSGNIWPSADFERRRKGGAKWHEIVANTLSETGILLKVPDEQIDLHSRIA